MNSDVPLNQSSIAYILISSEDDVYSIKGGIGIYSSILFDALCKHQAIFSVDWIVISHLEKTVVVSERKTKHYIIENETKFLDSKLSSCMSVIPNDISIIVEAPEWEGRAASFFATNADNRVTRITRLHSPLLHTAVTRGNSIPIKQWEQQITAEIKQIRHTDIYSSPTLFMKNVVYDIFDKHINEGARSYIIPNPVNIALFKPKRDQRNQSSNAFYDLTGIKLSENCFNIFVIGSIEERKGVHCIIEALNLFSTNMLNFKVIFLGHHRVKGNSMTLNEKLTQQEVLSLCSDFLRKNMHIAGCVDYKSISQITGIIDVCLVCYKRDNFPGVVAEMALSEVPMVTLMAGGIPEMLKGGVGYKLGVSISKNMAHDFGELLYSIYSEPNKFRGMAREQNEYFRENYCPDKVTDLMLINYFRN